MIHAELPKDSVMLLSVINTKLRDRYNSLEELCEDMQIKPEELISKLKMIDYEYSSQNNQFI